MARIITWRHAMYEGIQQEMRRDESVFYMGETIRSYAISKAPDGSVIGLNKEFGEERVRDTAIAETAIIGMGVGACVIVALVKQHGSDMSSAVRGITWASLGYLCFCYSTGYIMSFIFSVKHLVNNPEMINNTWAMIEFFSALSPLDSPWLTGFYVFSIVCSLAIGICGLVSLKRFRGEHNRSPILPSAHPGEETNFHHE